MSSNGFSDEQSVDPLYPNNYQQEMIHHLLKNGMDGACKRKIAYLLI